MTLSCFRCRDCNQRLGYLVDGDPYLPYLVCLECGDQRERDKEELKKESG